MERFIKIQNSIFWVNSKALSLQANYWMSGKWLCELRLFHNSTVQYFMNILSSTNARKQVHRIAVKLLTCSYTVYGQHTSNMKISALWNHSALITYCNMLHVLSKRQNNTCTVQQQSHVQRCKSKYRDGIVLNLIVSYFIFYMPSAYVSGSQRSRMASRVCTLLTATY